MLQEALCLENAISDLPPVRVILLIIYSYMLLFYVLYTDFSSLRSRSQMMKVRI